MNDEDIKRIMDLLVRKHEEVKKMTKKEAIASLHAAGILTKNGKFSKPYAILEQK